MGSINIEGSNWRLVEVGRVVAINGDHPATGRIGVIVEIIDHKRVLVDGPSSDEALAMPRQSVPLAKCLLTAITVEGLTRGARRALVEEKWADSKVDEVWKSSAWAKKREQQAKRKALTDFDRFKVMRLKKQRRFEERKALQNIKASS
ncbi:ribosomal protein L14 [Zalerion maritima]|uniref:Ribosomal protein L14 n=1 Tax=Zalerion maritima TaxID=339359 RepID=A0AAD5WY24_9PEZI|nr:ribosomal protein L14 [Zalerion maritima]